ncbi:trypsin-like peptidase domain-containing protein [Rhodovulum tesquicola]|uniref:trypsin-like serine peptidase n=1 Tax=Rhodovulum tesquicola TaxID=540254 RepID=UPI00209817D6|nr:trypsin-like serine protease [Rhodovulum tesquicola]MCO8144062.1 trypsin-like peptidase domain-containing protein [Rhodovulum tesquicola]
MAGPFGHIAALAGLLLALGAGIAAAQDGTLRALESCDASKDWRAVGRIEIGGRGFCTGALIAPDLVLTAAHCLFDRASGLPVEPSGLEFRAGWRNGRAEAYRKVRRGVVHPDYRYDAPDDIARVSHDLALLQLDQAIRLPGLHPFETGDRPRMGAAVGVVSYAQGRSEAPSLQEVCHVLALQPGVLMLSCEVDFGASGAPVFRIEDGVARIVSVVSAKAELAARPVALGTALGASLELLQGRLAAGEGVIGAAGAAPRFGQGGARASGGARFVRP